MLELFDHFQTNKSWRLNIYSIKIYQNSFQSKTDFPSILNASIGYWTSIVLNSENVLWEMRHSWRATFIAHFDIFPTYFLYRYFVHCVEFFAFFSHHFFMSCTAGASSISVWCQMHIFVLNISHYFNYERAFKWYSFFHRSYHNNYKLILDLNTSFPKSLHIIPITARWISPKNLWNFHNL